MAVLNNVCTPFKEPGWRLTSTPTANVTGKRFVAISGNKNANGTYSIAPPAAGGRVFGVAAHDQVIGKRVDVIRGPRGIIVPVTAPAAAIAAGAEVEVDATGGVIPKAAGVAVGYAVTASAGGGADAEISLY